MCPFLVDTSFLLLSLSTCSQDRIKLGILLWACSQGALCKIVSICRLLHTILSCILATKTWTGSCNESYGCCPTVIGWMQNPWKLVEWLIFCTKWLRVKSSYQIILYLVILNIHNLTKKSSHNLSARMFSFFVLMLNWVWLYSRTNKPCQSIIPYNHVISHEKSIKG